jgi:hypothetical protein
LRRFGDARAGHDLTAFSSRVCWHGVARSINGTISRLGKSDWEVSTMPSSGKKEAKIACTCNACELTLADGKATLHMLCGCEDCGQALQWGYKNGGIKPESLPRLYYMRVGYY